MCGWRTFEHRHIFFGNSRPQLPTSFGRIQTILFLISLHNIFCHNWYWNIRLHYAWNVSLNLLKINIKDNNIDVLFGSDVMWQWIIKHKSLQSYKINKLFSIPHMCHMCCNTWKIDHNINFEGSFYRLRGKITSYTFLNIGTYVGISLTFTIFCLLQ